MLCYIIFACLWLWFDPYDCTLIRSVKLLDLHLYAAVALAGVGCHCYQVWIRIKVAVFCAAG